jgi:hypothetical protein
MLETIKTILSCKLCEKILDQPVILPCCETVCGKHQELFKNKETSRCKLCDQDHELGETAHFLTNKVVECFLAGNISKLDFGENYTQASNLLKELVNAQDVYNRVKNKPEDLIVEKFQEMRNKVDLIREEIIQKVKNCSEKIHSDINAYEEECKRNLPNLNSMLQANELFDLSWIKADLSDWQMKMKQLYYDKELYTKINEKSAGYLMSLKNIAQELKIEILLGQEKKFEFETKYSNIFDTFYKHIGFNP